MQHEFVRGLQVEHADWLCYCVVLLRIVQIYRVYISGAACKAYTARVPCATVSSTHCQL